MDKVVLSQYCSRCQKWTEEPLAHRACYLGIFSMGAVYFIPKEGKMFCVRCKKRWKVSENIFYCSCGNKQKTLFVDEIKSLESGSVILKETNSGTHIEHNGTIVIAQRVYPHFKYQ